MVNQSVFDSSYSNLDASFESSSEQPRSQRRGRRKTGFNGITMFASGLQQQRVSKKSFDDDDDDDIESPSSNHSLSESEIIRPSRPARRKPVGVHFSPEVDSLRSSNDSSRLSKRSRVSSALSEKLRATNVLNAVDTVTLITQNSLDVATEQLHKATDVTAKHLTKATDVTSKHLAKATEQTTKQIGAAVNKSERVYKESRWCFWARWVGKFPKYFPRVFSLTFGVLVPLWLLILMSAGFGVLLADYEAPEERSSNHKILRSRARINRTFVKRTDIGQLPVDCYSQYLNQINRSSFEERINSYINFKATSSLEKLTDFLDKLDGLNSTTNITDTVSTDTNITVVNETERIRNRTNIFSPAFASSTNIIFSDLISITNSSNDTSPLNNNNHTLNDIVMEAEEKVMLYMEQCQHEQNAEIQIYLDVRDKHRDASAESMTFNWNRCWPKEINLQWGDAGFVFFPPYELIEASHPSQQAAAVETEFVRALDEAEKECLDLGGEEEACFEQALEDASQAAGFMCHDNVEGTSWFFFTIMTTVGYGNQTPVTHEGRLLIYIAGIVCLILFAGVLGSAGYIIMEIFDDFVSRFAISYFLQYPLVGVVLWGGIWISWAYTIAAGADFWWQERLPDIHVDLPDAFWFAFISTSTIGLGDYFLQPEVMFASDALAFSFEYLIGFVLLSTFLNKIGEFVFSILPKRDGNLEFRLRRTNLFFWKHWPCTDIEYLQPYMYAGVDPAEDESTKLLRLRYKQAKRVDVVKSLLPKHVTPPPPADPGEEKDMETLLDEEEMMLKMLLETVEEKRTEMRKLTSLEVPKQTPTTEETRQLAAIEEPHEGFSNDTDDALSVSSSAESSLIEL